MSSLSLSLGAETPVELAFLALGLVTHGEASRKQGENAMLDERGEGDHLVVKDDRGTATISSRAGSFAIDRQGQVTASPWFLALNPPPGPRLRSSRLRIGIAGGADERRLKMSWRALAELRHRDVAMTAILVGDGSISSVIEEQPHEVHHDPAPAEYLAILDRLDVVLECTDSFGSESFLAVAARDRGVPVVAHVDRPDLAGEGAQAVMWSADGFVDALLAIPREIAQPRDVRDSLRTVLELIENR